MAMPSGNVVISDKMQFPSGGAGGGEIHHRQWFPDERDGFISWLRGEFAAANAIIDSLCHHLWSIGEPGEYDAVMGSIQQRRCNWNPILNMQQYFSVAEVMFALQEAARRKQQRHFDQMKFMEKDLKKSAPQGVGSRQGHRDEIVKENYSSILEPHNRDANSSAQLVILGSEKGKGKPDIGEEAKQGGEVGVSDEKGLALANEKEGNYRLHGCAGVDATAKPQGDIGLKSSGKLEVTEYGDSEPKSPLIFKLINPLSGPCNALVRSGSDTIQNQEEKQNLTPIPQTFVGTEMFDGKAVNVVEGLKFYEELFDNSEIPRLLSLVYELRAAGRRGQFQGKFTNAFPLSRAE
ncbi:hypothetical protein HHK36_006697 [Tetracentron sinense]|uniref:Uncharacterized protein n=1 Tax=Tetracentron sinense TaxID=13715 RepID=A0A835DL27_TETSI|nr:hypothetical protein HHK36_006697 [Tetracentron sinense]